jgi:hypothetical protein
LPSIDRISSQQARAMLSGLLMKYPGATALIQWEKGLWRPGLAFFLKHLTGEDYAISASGKPYLKSSPFRIYEEVKKSGKKLMFHCHFLGSANDPIYFIF